VVLVIIVSERFLTKVTLNVRVLFQSLAVAPVNIRRSTVSTLSFVRFVRSISSLLTILKLVSSLKSVIA
jgi:hypothetical protein